MRCFTEPGLAVCIPTIVHVVQLVVDHKWLCGVDVTCSQSIMLLNSVSSIVHPFSKVGIVIIHAVYRKQLA